MKYTLKPAALALLMAGMAACEPEIEREFPANASGEADFSVYVALGDSYSAGVSDARLNRVGQINSFPAIIADKMAAVTPNFTFVQPLLPEGTVNGTLLFRGLVNGLPNIVSNTEGISATEAGAPVTGTFQNLAVPGARVADLTSTTMISDDAAYYFSRINSGSQSQIQMAAAQKPTFFTLFIGGNDVLGYATAGGEDDPNTGQVEAITTPENFRASYEAAIAALKQANPDIEGALGNIPNVNDIAYFNVVGWNNLGLTADQAAQLNAGFSAQINPVIRAQVIRGVITEGARRNVISAVAPQVIFQQVRPNFSSDEEAQAYVNSPEGQTLVNALITSLTNDRTPAAVHTIVEQQLATAQVQQSIEQNYQAALQADAAGQLAQAIGTTGAAQVEAIQAQQITQLKAAKVYPVFAEGANGFVVASNDSPTGLKQLTAGEKITLTALAAGILTPEGLAGLNYIIPDKYALDAFELQRISAATAAYNAIIADIATENTFALVDINAIQARVNSSGINEGGRNFTASFITGNLFSLDGVHLTQAGYALLAKEFIVAINSYYNAKLPLPDVSRYPTLPLPPAQSN